MTSFIGKYSMNLLSLKLMSIPPENVDRLSSITCFALLSKAFESTRTGKVVSRLQPLFQNEILSELSKAALFVFISNALVKTSK